VRGFLAAGAAVLIVFGGPSESSAPPDPARLMNELMSGRAAVGAPFTLTDQWGKPRSLAEFRGKVVLLYFGYTFCPDVCPTDLAAIAAMLRSLGPQATEVQPVFITLDPARDTPEVLRDYVGAFHPSFVALRGSEPETRRVATSFKVYYEKAPLPQSEAYLVDHMAFTFLLDRNGHYVAFFPPGTRSERIAVMVRDAL
jgi:cytochrome oxidase Cu insertion factor (SCO1/SenC/PrrC family)